MKKSASAPSAGLSRRASFPDAEQRHPWLRSLLDAYAIVDTGIAVVIRDADKKRHKRLACGQGCDVCCRQPDIPVYPHELTGIFWYAKEQMDAAVSTTVARQLQAHAKGSPCPFLLDRVCAIHPLRPASCRQFNVFSTPCAPGEDPYYARRDDVLTPIASYTDRYFAAVVPLYQDVPKNNPLKAASAIRERIMNLQAYDWKGLASMMLDTARQERTADWRPPHG